MSTPTGGRPPQGPQGPDGQPGGPQGQGRPAASGLARALVPIGVVVILLGVLGLFLLNGSGSGADAVAEAGDCVSRGSDDSIAAVDCGSADAAFRVAGVLEDTRSFEAGDACVSAYPATTASYFSGATGEPGTVLCLTAV